MTSCETCGELPLHDNSELQKHCKILKSGLKQCSYRCRNKQKIKTVNRRIAFAVCKCWPSDKNSQCHWRMYGNNMALDKDNSLNISKWTCQSQELKTTKSPSTITQTTLPSTFRIPPNLTCDKSRIINGIDALQNSWPWIVRMKFGPFMCGGTILNFNTIVTAAHCCKNSENSIERITGIIGDHNRSIRDSTEQIISVKSMHIHPDFNRRNLRNDICIIKTSPMQLGKLILNLPRRTAPKVLN